MKPWQNKEWCIPPEQNAAFVCAMEEVLEVYKRPYDETHPLICMDESSKQHVKEVHQQSQGRQLAMIANMNEMA